MKAPTAKEVLKKHLEGIKFPYNPNLESSFINAVHEYTQAHTKELADQIKSLQDWKESAMNQLNRINLQELGKELNVKLGSDIGEAILPAVMGLKDRIAELEVVRRPLGIQETRELVRQMMDEEISFSRFVELINEGGSIL